MQWRGHGPPGPPPPGCATEAFHKQNEILSPDAPSLSKPNWNTSLITWDFSMVMTDGDVFVVPDSVSRVSTDVCVNPLTLLYCPQQTGGDGRHCRAVPEGDSGRPPVHGL